MLSRIPSRLGCSLRCGCSDSTQQLNNKSALKAIEMTHQPPRSPAVKVESARITSFGTTSHTFSERVGRWLLNRHCSASIYCVLARTGEDLISCSTTSAGLATRGQNVCRTVSRRTMPTGSLIIRLSEVNLLYLRVWKYMQDERGDRGRCRPQTINNLRYLAGTPPIRSCHPSIKYI